MFDCARWTYHPASILAFCQMQEVLIPPFASLLGKYAGGVRVDEIFKQYLFEKLLDGEVNDQGEVDTMLYDGLRDFQRSTKLEFLSPTDADKVQVGSRHLNDDGLRIKRGVMTVPGCSTNTPTFDERCLYLTLGD